LLAVFFEEGDDVECLLNVCVIGEEGEDYSQFAPKTGRKKRLPPPAGAKGRTGRSAGCLCRFGRANTANREVKISPRAKNLAAKTGADIRFAQPTGASGRIIERDIQKVIEQGRLVTPAAAAEYTGMQAVEGTGIGGRVTTADLSAPAAAMPMQPSEAPFEEVKLSNIRKIIAKSMHQSLAQSAQLTLNTTFDASDIIEFRKKLKEKAEELGLPKITINDIIVYVVSRALLNHKELNAHFLGDTMRLFSGVHVGIACDTRGADGSHPV
jgi:pyruvate dehydrogenase E2 component (dihydrolipoamide acetyltransferase)